ncbi:hypothetical protein BAC3_02033 [uncultured bacterium]|nr:hypothetical protein BAC3_02033 [uncultured bacterium]
MLSAFCLLNIMILPINKYEWMLLEDPEMVLPFDNNALFYRVLAVLPIAFLSVFIVIVKTKKMKLIVMTTMASLLSVWLYKFF